MKVVAYACTRNLYDAAWVSINSLLRNNKGIDKVLLIIEDDAFTHLLNKKVEVYNYHKLPEVLNPHSPNMRSVFTYMSLVRLCLPKWFPQYHKILWLDCDTLIVGNIESLWDIDMTDYAIAAVEDVMNPIADKVDTYINTGVCLYNFKYLREHGLADLMLNEINTVKHKWADQDVTNLYSQGHIYLLDYKYNEYTGRSRTFDPLIWHWAGVHEWWKDDKPKAGIWNRFAKSI